MLIEALQAWKSANRIVNVNWPLKIYSNILKLIGSFQEVFQKCFIWKYPFQTPFQLSITNTRRVFSF